MSEIISFQPELNLALPEVIGNVDYVHFREILERIDNLLKKSNLDLKVMSYVLKEAEATAKAAHKKAKKVYTGLSVKRTLFLKKQSNQAFRCSIARHLMELSFRVFTIRLADSRLLQRFCCLEQIDKIQVPTKSTLERFEKMLPSHFIEDCCHQLNRDATSITLGAHGAQKLDLKESLDLNALYLDTTCVEMNIHYPVDWVLLRDATRSLTKAILCVREAGLKNRMDDPKEFMTRMNRWCIQMTHAKRQKGAKKKRKTVFREMKKLMKTVENHAQKHFQILKDRWKETKLTEKEAEKILERMKNILDQLPQAIKQAHERIIGERLISNDKKILSFYEKDVQVIVRKKSGKNVEFGNVLFLAEQSEGLLVDWKLYQDKVPGDATLIPEFLERVKSHYPNHKVESVVTDRGFDSKQNKKILNEKKIQNHMCPKSVPELITRLEEPAFSAHQRRRAQTEARVAIVKNQFLGKPLRSKGFQNQNTSLHWGVLAHNLWVIARLPFHQASKEKAA